MICGVHVCNLLVCLVLAGTSHDDDDDATKSCAGSGEFSSGTGSSSMLQPLSGSSSMLQPLPGTKEREAYSRSTCMRSTCLLF